ncbi:sensor histidine kinase [Calothrix sp. NIES-2098]|uniref:sensor histidine kinase n=1 Tax=Calothrix sp. NIES-2098 TaxID=1954171 RepID=UPI000B5F28F0|nr:multi-sensor hybrid histidine kinase [Calothrix sp. NIES-2098]
MSEFWNNLFNLGSFIPHGHCYLWKPELIWLHVMSDSLIALAYYSIPITLVYFVRQRQDLPFDWIFLMFSAFIIACGTTHIMEVWTLWYPTYWLSGLIKAITALVSVYTAISLVPLIPQAIALPSPTQLQSSNQELRQQITQRQQAENALQLVNDELETRVKHRTLELAQINEELKTEIAQRLKAQKRLQTLSGKLIEAQETERRRLARELHDEIGQALTAVKINLQTFQHSSNLSEAELPLQESIDIVEVALQQVRSLSLDLRPSLLDDLGLVVALRWYIDRQTQRSGIIGELVSQPLETKLSANLETTCFRIVQEALTNVVRHAKAQRVIVELWQQDTQLHLIIRDDGIGFDVNLAREKATKGGSLGLLGMEERVVLIGGQIDIKSVPQHGSKIHAIFPLSQNQT